MSKPKAVVLLSGGLDSATVLAMAMSQGFDAYAMSFQYGQRHAIEVEKAKEVAQQLGATRHIIVDVDSRAFGGSALTSDIAVPKDAPRAATSSEAVVFVSSMVSFRTAAVRTTTPSTAPSFARIPWPTSCVLRRIRSGPNGRQDGTLRDCAGTRPREE
jgi:Queuosine biosynthesis protein QueC